MSVMYINIMIRTQVYFDEATHKSLLKLAKLHNKTMAQIVRESVDEKVKSIEEKDISGVNFIQNLIDNAVTGGPKDLSINIDHYLYGAPKKKIKK